METFKEAYNKRIPPQAMPAVSATFKDGGIFEMVHDVDVRQTRFVLWRNGTWEYEDSHTINAVQRLVPYPGRHRGIRSGVAVRIQVRSRQDDFPHPADCLGWVHGSISRAMCSRVSWTKIVQAS